MNLLHVTPYYAPAYAFGGVTRAVEGMAQALAARGHRVTVLTTDALNQHERYSGPADTLENGVRVVRVRNLSVTLRGRANLSTPLDMRHVAPELIAWGDVIHCHEFRTAENLLVTPVAARLGKPLILSPHGTLTMNTGRSALKRWWDRLLSPAMARRFHTVVGLTTAELNDAQVLWAGFGARARFVVVPNGVHPEHFAQLAGRAAFRARWKIAPHEQVCLFLGRLHPRKGVDILIQAFKQADISNSRLVIAGPDEGMLAKIALLLDPRILVTGYLDSAERLAALAAADVFALPATGEGLSMSSLEAMASGLPVLLTPGCNLPEAAAHGAGFVVEPEIDTLATALRTLLTNPPLQAQMGARARELVQRQFNWARVAEQLEFVYQHAIL